jgi:hypothetical protein
MSGIYLDKLNMACYHVNENWIYSFLYDYPKEDDMDKKVWQKPELIVLVRSRPEEAVLENCKLSTQGTGSRACKSAGCPNRNNGGS